MSSLLNIIDEHVVRNAAVQILSLTAIAIFRSGPLFNLSAAALERETIALM